MMDQDEGFVAGQVHGLIGLVLALAGTHPEPALLLHPLNVAQDAAPAAVKAAAASDAFLAGTRDTVGRARSPPQKRPAAKTHR